MAAIDHLRTPHAASTSGLGSAQSSSGSSFTIGQDFLNVSSLSGVLSAKHGSALPTAPSIVPPKGGGAISSLGEKFNVETSTGAGSLSIPVHSSPGRKGIEPQLALQYDSSAGNGIFGLGWHIRSNASITRKTSKGLPLYHDASSGPESDVFILSGMEDLVPLFKKSTSGQALLDSHGHPVYDEARHSGHIIRRYLPRGLQTFSRIERWTRTDQNDDVHWRVITAENNTLVFGRDASSRIYDPSASSDGGRIYSWLQSEMYDPHGNAMIFHYKQEDSADVDTTAAHEANRSPDNRKANQYLKCIQYGNITPNRSLDNWTAFSAFQLPHENWKFSLIFDYGEHDTTLPTPTEVRSWMSRPDAFSNYRPGFELRTYRLCHRLLMFHHFTELNTKPYLVSSFELSYDLNSSVTKLNSVRQVGHMLDATTDRLTSRALPPATFHYHECPTIEQLEKLTPKDMDWQSLRNLPTGLDGTDYQWLDLNCEGLPGILFRDQGTWYYKRNTSASNVDPETGTASPRFGGLEVIRAVPHASNQQQMHFGDVKGSGSLDVVTMSPSAWGFYEREPQAQNGWTNYQYLSHIPNLDASKANAKLVDLTGDGLPDVLLCDDQIFTWYPSLGAEGYGPGVSVTQPYDETKGPICMLQDIDQTLYLADMSGDGLMDIVRIRNAEISYWPNCGYGRFGGLITMGNSPHFDYEDAFHHGNILLADVDGSGTTDLLYRSSEGLHLYMNQAGNSFSPMTRLRLSSPLDNGSVVNVVDLLGNGTSCVVWSSALPSLSPNFRYVDLTNGKKPHLLNRFQNGLGSECLIQYTPSTKFYLDDEAIGRPWLTKLPFAMHCVERVEMLDHIARTRFTKRYTYHHGYYDGHDREFRGFGRTEEWDTDTFTLTKGSPGVNEAASWRVPPVRTVSWFYTGDSTNGQSWVRELQAEYFGGAGLLPDSLGASHPAADTAVRRECSRSLKGKILRKEIYSDDGTKITDIPYIIQESNYTVNVYQGIQDSHLHAICSVFPRETIQKYLERQTEDPRIHHSLILDADSFGNIQKEVKIVYGRRSGQSSLTGMDKAKQETMHMLYAENDVTEILDEEYDYRAPSIFETRAYEISSFGLLDGKTLFSFKDLAGTSNDFSPLLSLQEIQFETRNTPSVPQKRLVSRARSVACRDDLTGLLPPGKSGKLGLFGETYTMCFTAGLVSNTYQQRVPAGSEESSPFDPAGILKSGFGNTKLGYFDLDNDGSWWTSSGTVSFSTDPSNDSTAHVQQARSRFFLPVRFKDTFGSTSKVEYDAHNLVHLWNEDAVGNRTAAEIDYRVLKPWRVTDANGNRTAVAFDALGMVVGVAVMGKATSGEGDSLSGFETNLSQATIDMILCQPRSTESLALMGKATKRIVYDYERFRSAQTPSVTASFSRVEHSSLTNSQRAEVKFEYLDGSGRVIQTMTQTKPGPLRDGGPVVQTRWVSSGWVIYNNKGSAVREFEPFFDDTHAFKFDTRAGYSPTMLYDPMARLVGILRQDHAFLKNVFTSWSESVHDFNDNTLVSHVGNDEYIGHLVHDLPDEEFLPSWYNSRIGGRDKLEKAAAEKAAAHAATPRLLHTDALGRVIMQIDDLGAGNKITLRSVFDIGNNVREVSDQLGRVVMKFDYDMRGQLIHQASMESGESWVLPDASGQSAVKWNSNDARVRRVYDDARRPIQTWMKDATAEEVMVEQRVYGETAPAAADHNLKDKLYKMRDGSGEKTNTHYDFKGNISRTETRLALSYRGTLDWSADVKLQDDVYARTTVYDALGRHVSSILPDLTNIYRMYDDGGHTNQIFVNIRGEMSTSEPSSWSPVVTDVDHNAKGLLTRVSYGNGTTTLKTYDPLLNRLTRMQTTTSNGSLVQDLSYTWDPVGNITHVQDGAQQTIFFRNHRVDPFSDYTYDATYRLVTATGREHIGQTGGVPKSPVAPSPNSVGGSVADSPTDGNAMASYTESYAYDSAGNILSVAHALSDPSHSGWRRSYSYEEPSLLDPGTYSNRLSRTTIASTSESYTYDVLGNMASMSHVRRMVWDYNNRLCATSKQVVTSGTPETTYYVYDASGRRVRKVTDRQSTGGTNNSNSLRSKDCIYLDGIEITRTWSPQSNTPVLERSTVHVEHEGCSVFQVQSRTFGSDKGLPRLLRFAFSNNLDSVSLILDDQGRLVSYEEYFPFGSTSYQTIDSQTEVSKQYRYSGKEKDNETGLYYYGARYFAPWLGRWTSPDPGGIADGHNLYWFVRDNPISFKDAEGFAAMALGLALPLLGEALAATGAAVLAVASSPVVLTGAAIVVAAVGVAALAKYATSRRGTEIIDKPPPQAPTKEGDKTKTETETGPVAPPTIDIGTEGAIETIDSAPTKTKKETKPRIQKETETKEKPRGGTRRPRPDDSGGFRRNHQQQHHIFPKQHEWFWEAIGIDVDAAENLVMMPAWFHLLELHPSGYNQKFKDHIAYWVDWQTLGKTRGARVEFRNPYTGKAATAGEVRDHFYAVRNDLKREWYSQGVATPSVLPYMGYWDRAYYAVRPRSYTEYQWIPRSQWPR